MAKGDRLCVWIGDEVLVGALPDRSCGMVLCTKVIDGNGRLSVPEVLECGASSLVGVTLEAFLLILD